MRVGSFGYATQQGIGYLMKDFYDNGIVDEVLVKRYPRADRENHMEWYPPGTKMVDGRDVANRHHKVVKDWLSRVDVVLFFETPLDWNLMTYARQLGKRTAIMVMYEWWLENPPALPDLLLCPSDLDYETFCGLDEDGKLGPTLKLCRLNVPAPSGTWRQRTRARRFLHNAGHVGSRNHKGTDTLLECLQYVESPLHLTFRCQDKDAWQRLISGRAGLSTFGDGRLTVELGDLPRESLFAGDHDVYVAPERYNGLSLPLQEAFAAGMPVVTTDRYPHNTWLPTEPLVPVSRYDRVRVGPGYLEIDEAVVEPRELAKVLDGMYDRDIAELSLRGKAWAEANSWDVLKPKYRAALEAVL